MISGTGNMSQTKGSDQEIVEYSNVERQGTNIASLILQLNASSTARVPDLFMPFASGLVGSMHAHRHQASRSCLNFS